MASAVSGDSTQLVPLRRRKNRADLSAEDRRHTPREKLLRTERGWNSIVDAPPAASMFTYLQAGCLRAFIL